MKKYKTILFDLDGTLLDTITDITNSINNTLIKYNFDKKYTTDDVCRFIGDGAIKLINRVLSRLNVSKDLEEAFFKDYCKTYSAHRYDLTKPFDGIINVINELIKKDYRLGIISNKPHNDTLGVVNLYFKDMFDIVYGKQDGVPTKPNPEIFNLIKDKYNINEEETLYIGDMKVDIEFAKNVKIDVCIVSYGYGKINKNIGQNYTIDKIENLLDILED